MFALYSLGAFLYCFLKAAENLLVLAYPSFSAISAMDKFLPDSKTSECSNLHCCIYLPNGTPRRHRKGGANRVEQAFKAVAHGYIVFEYRRIQGHYNRKHKRYDEHKAQILIRFTRLRLIEIGRASCRERV